MEEKKSKKVLTGVLIVIIVLLLCVVGYLLFGKNLLNNKSVNDSDNISSIINNLSRGNDKSVLKEIKISSYNKENKNIYNENNNSISISCDDNKDSNCIIKYNNYDLYKYVIYSDDDLEAPNDFILYVLDDYVVFSVVNETGMTFDFKILSNSGKIIFDTNSEVYNNKNYDFELIGGLYSPGLYVEDTNESLYYPVIIENSVVYFAFKDGNKEHLSKIDLNSTNRNVERVI